MKQKIVLSGGTGLIGKALTQTLVHDGAQVVLLVRRRPQLEAGSGTSSAVTEVDWHPEQPVPMADPTPLEGCSAAVHLSGANVGEHRWTPSYKQTILASRVDSSYALKKIFGVLHAPPPVVVAASATGYYGDRGDEVLTEASGPGTGFLAEVCQAWEAATSPLAARVVQLRFSVVLASSGGALPQLLRAFRLGLGGRMGNGRQWMSWISLEDAVAAIKFAIAEPSLSGPCNTTSPFPVTNAEFTDTLGRLLHRPTFLRVPALLLRGAFGEMANETVLASTRAVPERLHASGFRLSHERLEHAVSEMV
jgi:hypothetical protein